MVDPVDLSFAFVDMTVGEKDIGPVVVMITDALIPRLQRPIVSIFGKSFVVSPIITFRGSGNLAQLFRLKIGAPGVDGGAAVEVVGVDVAADVDIGRISLTVRSGDAAVFRVAGTTENRVG